MDADRDTKERSCAAGMLEVLDLMCGIRKHELWNFLEFPDIQCQDLQKAHANNAEILREATLGYQGAK